MKFEDCIDFRLDFNVDRYIKTLQITDMQPVDPSQQRYDGRLDYFPFNTPFTDKMKYENEFYYIDKAIKDSKPSWRCENEESRKSYRRSIIADIWFGCWRVFCSRYCCSGLCFQRYGELYNADLFVSFNRRRFCFFA